MTVSFYGDHTSWEWEQHPLKACPLGLETQIGACLRYPWHPTFDPSPIGVWVWVCARARAHVHAHTNIHEHTPAASPLIFCTPLGCCGRIFPSVVNYLLEKNRVSYDLHLTVFSTFHY